MGGLVLILTILNKFQRFQDLLKFPTKVYFVIYYGLTLKKMLMDGCPTTREESVKFLALTSYKNS